MLNTFKYRAILFLETGVFDLNSHSAFLSAKVLYLFTSSIDSSIVMFVAVYIGYDFRESRIQFQVKYLSYFYISVFYRTYRILTMFFFIEPTEYQLCLCYNVFTVSI
jgi:hypothetical protein